MLKGIDVSKWQGQIDFNAVKRSGVDFVIIQAGYGKSVTQKDPYFEQNYARAKAAGLKVGAYWFSYALTPNEAAEEARTCAAVIANKQDEKHPTNNNALKIFLFLIISILINILIHRQFHQPQVLRQAPHHLIRVCSIYHLQIRLHE